MNWLISLGRSLVKNPLTRAFVLKGIRHGITAAGPIVTAWLLSHGYDHTWVASFVAYGSGTVLTGAGMLFSYLDGQQVNATVADLKAQVATAEAPVIQVVQAAPTPVVPPLTNADVDKALGSHSL